MPGVWLNALRTDKFRTDVLSISLLSQLCRETAAMNAVIPNVLLRGTTLHPDMASIGAALDELYGASVFPVVRRIGEIQATGFYASFAGGDYVPGGERLLSQVAALCGELLLSPATRGGLLLPAYVDSERQKLLDRIRAQKNDKGSYALQRLIENMCAYEDFSTNRLGSEAEAEAIHYQKLTRHYRELLASAPIEVFYCGCAEPDKVVQALRTALEPLPRGELNDDIGTDVRMNSVEEEPRYFTESMDVGQGKLAIGWRLGACMEEPDIAAIRVFNAVFGGSVTSKLFANVRERLSLCYYASSSVELNKGLLVVSSGIEFDKYDAAKDEIFAQLEAVKHGEVSEAELDAAKKSVAGDLRAIADSPLDLEGYWLSRCIEGFECAPEELAALCESVTLDDVVSIAGGVECDAVYFLRGKDGNPDE